MYTGVHRPYPLTSHVTLCHATTQLRLASDNDDHLSSLYQASHVDLRCNKSNGLMCSYEMYDHWHSSSPCLYIVVVGTNCGCSSGNRNWDYQWNTLQDWQPWPTNRRYAVTVVSRNFWAFIVCIVDLLVTNGCALVGCFCLSCSCWAWDSSAVV